MARHRGRAGRRGRRRGGRPSRALRRRHGRQRRVHPVRSPRVTATSTRPQDSRPWSPTRHRRPSDGQRRDRRSASGASGAQLYIPAVWGFIAGELARGFVCFPRCGRIARGQVNGAEPGVDGSPWWNSRDSDARSRAASTAVRARSRHLRGRPARMASRGRHGHRPRQIVGRDVLLDPLHEPGERTRSSRRAGPAPSPAPSATGDKRNRRRWRPRSAVLPRQLPVPRRVRPNRSATGHPVEGDDLRQRPGIAEAPARVPSPRRRTRPATSRSYA